jgi:3-oxoacyl-[acyl-carrier-protein] synthase II
MSRRPGVVITGLGLVLPHGRGLAAADAVFAGRSAVRRLDGIPGMPDATAAPLDGFQPPAGTEDADRAIQFAVAAAEEAWSGAGLGRAALPADRIATVISLSKGGILALADCARRFSQTAAQQAGRCATAPDAEAGTDPSRNLWTKCTPDAAALAVAARLGLRGPVAAPLTACASGAHALAWGAMLIERGAADAALVGAAEASIHPLILGSYRRMGVLAPAGDDAATSVRPFSATRCGFAIGEGAGILVLESEASAARRGARPLARVCGWALGCQASGLADMEPTGAVLARLLSDALRRAGVAPEALDYINAHGTATRSNDLAEARAIRAALAGAAGRVSVSSTKGAHGHLLGAAAAVELVLTVLAMVRSQAPPTANLTDPDPQVGLDCTPLTARARPIRYAAKIASGFGGQAAVLVLGL